ncbi:carbohydrate-binding module family 1 [Daldinia caldariorum]|uniref:carbohydrate-binding module family 1 n=1 Tax=Daldinia caldariorum TaxID=326644 RepID=UPI002007BE27|nr:carbohydrate-binding module family 1 [Daldinia caldariorum]KAI1465407.1 carbohydrate-binding module family 1 [Daldinia caldariorum]
MKYLVAGLLSLLGAVSAEGQLWAQCGGQGFTGQTTCPSGSTCRVSNQWYSQCVPSSNSASSASQETASTTAVVPPAATSFAKTDGLLFNIDGETKYYAGTNSYWISFLTNNADVDKTLDQLKAAGHKILRIWGFNDVTSQPGSGTVYFQHLSARGSTINTGPNGLQRLDYVVSSAEKRGIKLIINFVNNWSDYGGIPAYVTAFGGTQQTWYTNAAAQNQYRAYIRAVVPRYANSSAIFAWELANEPRCKSCATSVLTGWARTTSAYVKSLDPGHMVTLGDEGFGLGGGGGDASYPYQLAEGLDFAANLAIDTLDFGTFHLYPSSWGTLDEWGNKWIEAHGAACAAAGKPCLFEEYGSATDHCGVEGKWQKTALSTKGLAADLFWQLGTTLSTGQTHNDGYTIYTGSSEWTCLVTNHIAAIK